MTEEAAAAAIVRPGTTVLDPAAVGVFGASQCTMAEAKGLLKLAPPDPIISVINMLAVVLWLRVGASGI